MFDKRENGSPVNRPGVQPVYDPAEFPASRFSPAELDRIAANFDSLLVRSGRSPEADDGCGRDGEIVQFAKVKSAHRVFADSVSGSGYCHESEVRYIN